MHVNSRQRPTQRRSAAFSYRALTGLLRDKAGATATIVGLLASVLIGFAGIGTEMSLWYFTHRDLQNAADSAAASAVASLFNHGNGDYRSEARATAANYGFVDQQNGVNVTVNKPPTSGNYTADNSAVEVIISQPQQLLFTALFESTAPTQSVRSVATAGTNGNGCVIALDKGAVNDIFNNGNTTVNLQSCDLYVNSDAADALSLVGQATINAQNAFITGGVSAGGQGALNTPSPGGTYTGVSPINDPYLNVPEPAVSTCANGGGVSFGGGNLGPGRFCGGLNLTGNVVLTGGLYIVDGGCFCVGSNGNITTAGGAGVTIFLTGSGNNFAGLDVKNSTLQLVAQTTGPQAGLAIFQSRGAPLQPGTNTNKFHGGGLMNIAGVIYFPNQNVTYDGGSGSAGAAVCEQMVALTLTFHGNSHFQTNCAGVPGVANIGAIPAALVE